MIWVWIAIAIPALFVLLLAGIRFHLEAVYLSPLQVTATAKIAFLGLSWKKDFHFQNPNGSTTAGNREGYSETATTNTGGTPFGRTSSESGFVAVPESWRRKVVAARRRVRPALKKLLLDPAAWKIVAGYLLTAGGRLIRLVKLRLRFLSLGLEDVLSLAKIAAAISVLRGLFPFLGCPIEYGFCQRPAMVRVRCAAGFSALSLACVLFMLIFTIPWFRLGGRFRAAWRNPELNAWQARIAAAL